MVLLILIQFIIFSLFAFLMVHFIKREKFLDLFLIFLAVLTVTLGEALNLFVYKMAVYNGVCGIPAYIILGGAMLTWGIYKLSSLIFLKFNIECIFCKAFIVVILSLFLPLIEVIGLKTGLWYWQRAYSIVSLSWFLGVWKFYFIFIVSPVIIGLFLDVLKGNNRNCCK